jgi:hypothetical protein
MATQPEFIRHIYKVDKVVQSYKIFRLSETPKSSTVLTELIKLETFRGFSNASRVVFSLTIRNANNWSKCTQLTGLRKTTIKNVFYGNSIVKEKSLILLQVNKETNEIIIDFYRSFYPFKQGQLLALIKNHKY